MLSVAKLIESAIACLGWPYESPGNNDQTGIDCSGLFVKAFRDQGGSIYHGSNTIFREYCTETGKLTDVSQLRPGMAVFKCKPWTDSEADKKNRWYGKSPGNLSHIGMVTSVNPLVITHATSPVCKQDFKLGNWAYLGKLKNVDYGEEPSPAPEPEPIPDPEPDPEPSKIMQVYAENGQPVNMRVSPKLSAKLVDKVPVGQSVTWLKENGAGWGYIQWKKKKGWMLECFLVDEGTPIPDPEADEPLDPGDGFPDDPTGEQLTVWAEKGSTVKLRASKNPKSKAYGLYDDVPIGATVTLVEYGEKWCKVDYGFRKGWYMMTQFLSRG